MAIFTIIYYPAKIFKNITTLSAGFSAAGDNSLRFASSVLGSNMAGKASSQQSFCKIEYSRYH
jgi:hypothetical protein